MTALSEQSRHEVRSADGTMLPVYKSGAGRPLVIFHGATVSHSAWDAVRPHLEPHVTVLAVDRRNVFVDPAIRYDVRREFEDVVAVAAAADGDEVDVLGHSSGAICALGASLLIPKLRRLVLYEPPFVAEVESTLEEMDGLVRSGNLDGAAELALRDSLKLSDEEITARKASPEWANYVERIAFRVREEAVFRSWEPSVDAFRSLKTPTLYLVGGNTAASHHHRGYIRFLESAGVDLTVVEIPGQEHAANREVPELFAKLLLDFLEAD